ncbi:rhomboid family intramembrane serine protease [Pedobacter frigiditerrae]|uniref:Rhomboid family intramembrane serine protease n=1 Tax=Pedobacter frigiditerrae TaxID=2530452 RepID=A0A4R0MYB4_9SPHI|nr:rhomboid family intramembrane serine protease [Pedobacter frigiditerrae]TCC91897.1 rhomboid family intramembrane serine protease [Pedobacter frigiditerrae]
MAFGLTPKHTEEIYLTDLSPEQFLALAIETANQLKWQINYVSETGIIAYTNKGLFSWNADIKILMQYGNTIFITSESAGNEMIDWGKNKKTVNQFLDTFEIAKLSFTPEELTLKHIELEAELPPPEQDYLQLPPQTFKEQIKDFFSMFVPTKEYFITPILVNLNLLVFILMLISGVDIIAPTGEALLSWGANFRPYTLNDQPWRLITNCFLHIGIIHLVMNIFALLYIGALLEPILGKVRFFAAYLLTGLIASITSMCWHELSISAGASGAIFGMYGVFLALLTTSLIEKNTRKALLSSIAFFVVYNLIYGLKGQIDNAAHIGGLFSGILIGYAFLPSIIRFEETGVKSITIGFVSLVVISSCTVIYTMLPNNGITNQEIMNGAINNQTQSNPERSIFFIESDKDRSEYQSIMKDFASIESMALDIYPLDTTVAGKEQALGQIKNRGIYYWNRSLEVLAPLNQLKLPPAIIKQNKLLNEYCLLYIELYNLMYVALEKHSKAYDKQIDELHQKINVKLEQLKAGLPK